MEGFTGTKGVKVAVLCDPDQQGPGRSAAKEFEKKYGYKPETETDLRKVYDRKDVDVVGVATPNHWHALATIWACQAGKDVYVEKPGSHNIFEGRKMVEAAKKYDRVVQHGVQLRSSEAVREAVEHMRDGPDRQGLHGPRPGLPQPALDRPRQGPGHRRRRSSNWDIWQGPAAGAGVLQADRPLQLALALGLRQRRRRQPGGPRDRHVPLGPRPRDPPQRRSSRWAASSSWTTTRRPPRSSPAATSSPSRTR